MVKDGVEEAVRRDLAELPGNLGRSALARAAVAMGSELDRETNSATSKANCAKVLARIMETLRALAEPEVEDDALDQLAEKRAKRTRG